MMFHDRKNGMVSESNRRIFCGRKMWCYLNTAAIIYLFRVNNRNTRTISAICSKLTIQTTEQG